MKHTPGLLENDYATIRAGNVLVADLRGTQKCGENAARLAACWNACVDLSDPSVVPELVKALDDLLSGEGEEPWSTDNYGDTIPAHKWENVRAILARCKQA